ncbi:MAG: hypothetical protein CVU57_20980 [Deltaproteobacteria bacterium HGW-Deltaproteobacteria-15]|jgi:hypothetical protein|nr:MAG: hypothetical protein CVU57_20980 [Deltaproteobacteria bacterium HGW-Deltaproteobacteria-15]
MTPDQKSLLQEWDTDLRVICHGHYDAAVLVERRHHTLGVLVVALTATIGTAVFATLGKNPSSWAQIIVGLASLGASVLAALQTFLKYSERAEKHRQAGAFFGSLLKEIEQIRALPTEDDGAFRKWANSFRSRWDEVSKESPTIPIAIFQRRYAQHKGMNAS